MRTSCGRRPGARWSALGVLTFAAPALAVWLTAGCAHNPPRVYGAPGASGNPAAPWKPPAKAVEQQKKADRLLEKTAPTRSAEELSAMAEKVQNLGLAEIADIALRNSPQTRLAWARALSAAAAYGSERGAYFPEIDASGSVTWQKSGAFAGRSAFEQRLYSVNGSLSWLLFDFGGREASVEQTRQALLAADWLHNASIQNVLLQVEQAYYDYFATKALLDAQQATVKEEQANLNAAEDRHRAGVATQADVLQARTALSQADLTLEALQGQVETTRGALATSMGLPAYTAFDVELPAGEPPVQAVQDSVEHYLEIAKRSRPDLAAARAEALAARAQIHAVRARGLPALRVTGSLGRQYVNELEHGSDVHSASLGLSFPLFTGFSQHYDVAQAKADAEAALASLQSTRDLVTLQVWTSYYDLRTATQRLHTSHDLLDSATQNYDVASGRYREGVGSILDLLTAQSALESARAQSVQARTDWYMAAAQLAHDTGVLDISTLAGPEGEGSR